MGLSSGQARVSQLSCSLQSLYVWYTHDTNTAILLAIELAALKFQANTVNLLLPKTFRPAVASFEFRHPLHATEMMSRTYQFHRKAPNRCGPKRPQISTDDGNRYGTTLIFPLESTVSSVTSCMHTYVVFLPWKTSDFIGDPIYCESYYSYVDSVVIFAKL